MTRRRIIALLAVPLTAGTLLGAVAGASASPAPQANCVAQLTSVYGPNKGFGGPGIRFVAHEPTDYCFIP